MPTEAPTGTPTDTPVPMVNTDTPMPPTATPTEIPTDTPVPEPTVDPRLNPLTGNLVDDPAKLQRRPILVRYGNDAGAWPHAGISQAEVVMEDIMEAYWITRITAVFLATDPEAIGPLRSARPISISTTEMFEGTLVYSGASDGVNQLLAQTTFPKINEGTRGNGFYRSATKRSPHNLYSSSAAVRKVLADSGQEKAVELAGFVFAAEVPQGQPAAKIHIPYPKTSTVDYAYDPGLQRYMRLVQGLPYLDELTNAQVGMANVIVIYAPHEKTDIVEDSLGSTSINIVTTGEGRVQIFRDGVVLEGIWKRGANTDLFRFTDQDGNNLPLKPGSSWIQFVPPDYELGITAN